MTRNRLPNHRQSYNFTLSFQGERYDVTVGHYPSGDIGELFINRIRSYTSSKLQTSLDGVCRDAALLFSLAIQRGETIENIRHALTRDDDNEPATIIGAIIDHLTNSEPFYVRPIQPPKPNDPTADGDADGPTEPPNGGPHNPPSTECTPPGGEREREDTLDRNSGKGRD